MKKLCVFFLAVMALVSLSACSKVPAGNVGVKVYLLGGTKGVDHEVLGVGRYWIGINEELYLFPTFTQNYVWAASKDEGSKDNESITFQTKEGMDVNTDIGISYHIDPAKVGDVFQKYRKGVDEITDIFLRNMVRDALIQVGAKNPVESVYGEGKTALINEAQDIVKNQVKDIGIVVEKIYLVGSMRLPAQVVAALNSKITATQQAQQRENELRMSEAEAKKKIAIADGDAQSTLLRAKAQAEANKLLSNSITPTLVQYESIQKWDGKLPQVGGATGIIPMIDMKVDK